MLNSGILNSGYKTNPSYHSEPFSRHVQDIDMKQEAYMNIKYRFPKKINVWKYCKTLFLNKYIIAQSYPLKRSNTNIIKGKQVHIHVKEMHQINNIDNKDGPKSYINLCGHIYLPSTNSDCLGDKKIKHLQLIRTFDDYLTVGSNIKIYNIVTDIEFIV